MEIEAPLKDSTKNHWKIPTIPIQDIGTDPTTATNFVNDRYDLSSTGIDVSHLREVLGFYYKERFRRIKKYGGDAADQQSIAGRTEDTYARRQLSGIDLSHVSNGAGLKLHHCADPAASRPMKTWTSRTTCVDAEGHRWFWAVGYSTSHRRIPSETPGRDMGDRSLSSQRIGPESLRDVVAS